MRNALVLSGGGAWGSWQVGACEHTIPLLFPPTQFAETGEVGVDGGLHHAAPLDDALEALAELPPEPEPPHVWVMLLSPRSCARDLGIVQRLLGMAGPSFKISREPGPWGATRAEDSLLLSGRLHDRPVAARLHVLRPDQTLTGTVLDFDPEMIRASYADGLRTARRASEPAVID